MNSEKINEDVPDSTDLAKAVKLLEDNGFYVVYANSGFHNEKFTGALSIRAYPRRATSLSYLPNKTIKI